jgi:UDP-GlcNAc:undecaprenyl-phosphate/decaprenyl-phosphate GlcNAc-1-phosphate transferase
LWLELRVSTHHEGVLFETERPAGSSLPVESRVELALGERRMGHLSATWRDGRVDIDRDDELALELIADAVAAMAARLIFPPLSAAENVVPIRK